MSVSRMAKHTRLIEGSAGRNAKGQLTTWMARQHHLLWNAGGAIQVRPLHWQTLQHSRLAPS